MTDLDDLIARLRGFGPTSPASPAEVLAAIAEAAAALEALRDEVARKDAALKKIADGPPKPFPQHGDTMQGMHVSDGPCHFSEPWQETDPQKIARAAITDQ